MNDHWIQSQRLWGFAGLLLSVALVLSVHAQEKRISDAVRRPKPATSVVPATGTAARFADWR